MGVSLLLFGSFGVKALAAMAAAPLVALPGARFGVAEPDADNDEDDDVDTFASNARRLSCYHHHHQRPHHASVLGKSNESDNEVSYMS
jgi:hypothetical protein